MKKTTAYGRRLKRNQATAASPFSFHKALGNVQPFTDSELIELQAPPRVAFESLVRGSGTEHDFSTLACIANNTLICAESIHPDCVEVAKLAQEALMIILARHARLGKWGVCSRSMQDIPPVIDLHEQLLTLYTPVQMRTAMAETTRRMKAGQILAVEN